MADLDFRVKNGLVVGSNTTTIGTAVYVTPTGNVGISNSAPTHKFSVNGDSNFTGTINANTGINFVDQLATTNTDHSRHIDLWGNSYGFNVMSNLLNINSNQNIILRSGGTERFRVNNAIVQAATNTFTIGTALYVTATGNVGFSNSAPVHKFRVDGDISLSGGIHANGSLGATGHVLYSNGTASYWAAPAATGVTSVASGDGLTGGPITGTGTLSVVANTGLIANSTGIFVNANTGLVGNATGVHVRANSGIVANATGVFVNANTGLIANATGVYVNANTGLVGNATGVHVNSTFIGTLTSNNSTFAFGKSEANLNVNSAIFVLANSGIISNSTGVFVNANTGLIANSTGVFVNANTGLVGNATGIHVNSAYINTISSNTARFLTGTATVSSNADIISYVMGTNDAFRIQVGGGADAGYVEIATADGGNEPIFVRQYQFSGVTFGAITRTLTLLDGSGNTLVPGSIIPVADNTQNLGNTTFRWANIYTGDFHLSNEGSNGNDVDGTTGSWTIQEGENDLFILNKKTGKKYKFKLEEIL